VASYIYQDHLFSQDVRDLTTTDVLRWRERFGERLQMIAERYPPRIDVDLEAMADMVTTIADGGIILSKALRDSGVLPKQIMLYRAFVKLVFLGN
jgi:hypothetical protein